MSRKQKELEISAYAVPRGFRRVYDNNYILKVGDLFGSFEDSIKNFTIVSGLAGRKKQDLIKHENLLVLEKLPEMEFLNELNESKIIPTRNFGGKKYHLIEDENYKLEKDDLIFDKDGKNYLGTIGSWVGRKYGDLKYNYTILSPIKNNIILPEVVINFDGRKFKRITDENYRIENGEFLFRKDKWDEFCGQVSGYKGIRLKDFPKDFDVFSEIEDENQIFKMTTEQRKNGKVPENFEILGADEIIQFNDYYWDSWGKEWIMARSNWKKRTIVENRRMVRFKLSPEQKIDQLKKKAKLFVQKNIRNATEEDFKKFETVFLRDDNFGL